MKTITILTFLTGIFLAGCKSMDSDPRSGMENLYYSSPLNIPGKAAENLTVALKELKDTRCPQYVICIQPGFVNLTLLISDKTDTIRIETTFYGNSQEDKLKSFRLGDAEYLLQ